MPNETRMITEKQIEGMERLGVPRSYIEKLLKSCTLEEVAKYIRDSLKTGDDSDDAAGPRTIDQ